MKKKVSIDLSYRRNRSSDMPMVNPRILIADDHAVIRTGMKYLLARHFKDVFTGEADACSTLMTSLEKESYSHLILDMQLGDCNSFDLIPEILARYPEMLVMAYTMSPEAIYGKRLLQMGVLSFLSKEEEEETLITALTLFLEGQPYLSEALRTTLEHDKNSIGQSANPFEDLSEREMAVLRYLLQGLRVKEIANKLELKMSTVATYKVRIFEKLNVNNVADMQRLADVYHLG